MPASAIRTHPNGHDPGDSWHSRLLVGYDAWAVWANPGGKNDYPTRQVSWPATGGKPADADSRAAPCASWTPFRPRPSRLTADSLESVCEKPRQGRPGVARGDSPWRAGGPSLTTGVRTPVSDTL